MINITTAQIKNSIDIEINFTSIKKALLLVEHTDTDVILFPECSLSGFSSKIKLCTPEKIGPYLDYIDSWSKKFDKAVILPTAMFDTHIYNTGYIFNNGSREQFFKTGLTESEKVFFSKPNTTHPKVFKIKGYNLALLICFEAQMKADAFFKKGEVDIVLWPGYWGWSKNDLWTANDSTDEPNLIYENTSHWKIPLIQANFAFNDLGEVSPDGPKGLSMFVNSDNTLFSQGEYETKACYKITISKNEILNVNKLGEL